MYHARCILHDSYEKVNAGFVYTCRSTNRQRRVRLLIVVKRAAKSAGLGLTNSSGHSLRVGFVTSAVQGGASEIAVMDQTYGSKHAQTADDEYICPVI